MWEAGSKWKTPWVNSLLLKRAEILEKRKTWKEKLDGKYFTKTRKQKNFREGMNNRKIWMVNILPGPLMKHRWDGKEKKKHRRWGGKKWKKTTREKVGCGERWGGKKRKNRKKKAVCSARIIIPRCSAWNSATVKESISEDVAIF